MPISDVVYGYIFSLYQYIRKTWPISIIYGPQLATPSLESQDAIIKAIQLLKESRDTDSQVFTLLQALTKGEDWLSVVDEKSGYDILQHAVLFRRKEVIVYLVTHGCNLDRYSCSSPVHLAAYLGEVGILKLLLDLGAKCNLKRGVCYPEPHIPISYETRYFSFTEHPVYVCKTQRLTPIQCAIHTNSLNCVKAIMNHESPPIKSDVYYQHLLMYSCREGAPDCIRYFVQNYPEYINSYMDGDTPLLAAVPWGEECANILLNNGADVHLRSEGILETALHRLYRQNIDGLFTIYDTTKYLLTTGLEQEVNAYTHLGETPLHMLISHISYVGGNYVDPQRKRPRLQLQESYQKQVLAAINLILEFNADPHLLNSPGLTPLSRVLHIALKAVCRQDQCECVQSAQPDVFIADYQNHFDMLGQALNTLLKYGSDPNFKCAVGHTPLTLLLQVLLYDNLSNICSQHQHVIQAFNTLLSNKADPNFTVENQGTAYSLLAMICLRCFQSDHHPIDARLNTHQNSTPPQSLRIQFANVMNDVLATLLKHGLNPNPTTTKISQHLQGGSGNGMIEFVRLASHASSSVEFTMMEKWIRTLLQWGADPDLEPYPAEPIICHCQSSIFLKKLGTQPLAHYIHEVKDREALRCDPSVQQILLLFYHSMSERTLRECLTTVRVGVHIPATQMVTHSYGNYSSLAPVCDGRLDLQAIVTLMCDRPRALKELSRLAIYKAMNRDLSRGVGSLPLPHVVKNYLLQMG